ncbi:PP2C family protein-serine/threonine phosphatase [Pseudomonas sp. EpS/L25]|uniref:PP2C family protein-serine/threonine phosphatase n=1 Tax=Pseudomonas sp. EpS/L25 TaxID=1749078 RepID=UPI0007442A5F|nr:PP2C family serine/threonine-protein phosphatase [Pseudomonas sp. EpS/L25]KUM42778.1 protein phosphatase [Pseudomonas sp. EpS/L25]
MSLALSSARSHPGKVRARNEDALLERAAEGLWAVADGMGGHQEGARASRLVVERLAELALGGSLDERLEQVRLVLHEVNRRLTQDLTVLADSAERLIGTTVVALLLADGEAACVWAGDSRAYLWRGNQLYQLTRDHSLLERLVEVEGLTPQQATRHPSARALTRALGAQDELALDIVRFELLAGDRLLLSSDGLHGALEERTLGAALSLPTPAVALERLLDGVLQGPARDNLTAIVIHPLEAA